MRWMAAAVIGLVPAAAGAEVISASANGFHLRQEVQLVVPTARAYDSFAQIGSWWDKEHSYSGDAANLSLALSPGGCFCERLANGGGIEHMRVTYVDPGKRVVLTGSLGPLLYQATTGVMDVKFERIAGGARVTMDYRVAGFVNGGGDRMAPLVDSVLAQQMARYRRFARSQPTSR